MAIKKTKRPVAKKKKPTGKKSPSGKKTAGRKGKPLKRSAPKKKVRKDRKEHRSTRPILDNPEAKALAQQIAQVVLDRKALDVVILDVRGKASYADYIVIASGESERQVGAMADAVDDTLRPSGKRPLSTEGQDTGNWVLLDYGEVVAHLFSNDVRSFYDLEGLWADAPKERVA